jgi:RNAse (barnase) inhibitor barstar
MSTKKPKLRTKLEWTELKKQYLGGQYEDVRDWWRSIGGQSVIAESTLDRRTKGWSEERAELQKRSIEAAKINYVAVSAMPNEKLFKMKENLLILVGKKIMKEKETLTPNDLKTLWQMVKTELQEPITITKNENRNENTVTFADFLKLLENENSQT